VAVGADEEDWVDVVVETDEDVVTDAEEVFTEAEITNPPLELDDERVRLDVPLDRLGLAEVAAILLAGETVEADFDG
jgi:hypothetical protein